MASRMLRRNLTTQLAFPTLVVTILGIAAFAIYTGRVARENTIAQLTMAANTQIENYLELRNYYAETVIAKVGDSRIAIAADHDGVESTIPLPATMIHDLAKRALSQSSSKRMRLYSRHPFPNRADRQLDDFASAALTYFASHPDGEFSELSEIDGERFVRVAIPDRMSSQTCVQCHNSHPETPRIGWSQGDIRGVLEIDLSAEDALATASSQQLKIFGFGAMLCVAILLIVGWVMRRVSDRLTDTVGILEDVSRGNLDVLIEGNEQDEIGAMKAALGVAITNMRAIFASLHQSRALIDQAPVSFLFCDLNFSITYANAHCRRTLAEVQSTTGVDPAVLKGGSVRFLFGDEAEMKTVIEDAGSNSFRGMRGIGDEIFDVSIEAISDSEGRRVGSLITLECVTAEEQNAIRLREAVEAERESSDALRESATRARQRADLDHEVATELRMKADRISEVVVAAATGDLTQRTDLTGDSPMDQIATDLDRFLDDLSARILQIREISGTLNQAGKQLDQVGQNLVGGARRTSDEVSSVARAWAATNEEVNGIGKSVEGLAESFESISENASTALEVAGSGVLAARAARTAIEDLDQSTKQIEAILTFIDQIADQSKLLSLNASIEAARAGESGRGFNVVAQEVKKLASQTEDATRQIALTVSEILERGDRSVASIHAIGTVIDEINESQGLISSTVLDQQQHARGVSRVTGETRQRANVVAASIEQLSMVAEATEADAAGTDREAKRLLDLATQISDLTGRFIC